MFLLHFLDQVKVWAPAVSSLLFVSSAMLEKLSRTKSSQDKSFCELVVIESPSYCQQGEANLI